MVQLPDTPSHRIPRIEHGRRARTVGIVIHDAEATSLAGVANYFATSSPDAVGAHAGIDDQRVEQWAGAAS